MVGVSWERFGPLCLLLILGSQWLNRRAQRIRWRNEVRSLRAGLKVGLHSLRDLYGENLHAVTGSKRTLVSGRHQLNLLRTQLGRLPSLKELEAETVMLACIAAERAETVLEAARKALAADVVVHRRDEKRAMAESAFQTACAALEAAEKLLDESGSTGTGNAAAREQGRPPIQPDEAGAGRGGTFT